MKSVLVTGGAGFIGSNFVHYWLRNYPGDSITVLDALTYAGNLQNLDTVKDNPKLKFVHGDICDAELVSRLMDEQSIDWIVHFAAESHVDRSISGPDEFIRTNVVGTHTLLKAARFAWSQTGSMRGGTRFHHVSTDEVYGSLKPADPPFTETTPYSPNSPYSASKASSDHLVRAYSHTYGLPVTITNCSNNYGPYHFPEKLIPLMIVNALAGKPLPIYGNGENVRDWLFVGDHCRAIDVVLRKGGLGEAYNIGGNNEQRNIDVVHTLCRLMEQKFIDEPSLSVRFPQCPAAVGRPLSRLISFVEDRLGHDWRYAIDARKVSQDLGFSPRESFDSGIAKTLDWYLSSEAWWRRVLVGKYWQ